MEWAIQRSKNQKSWHSGWSHRRGIKSYWRSSVIITAKNIFNDWLQWSEPKCGNKGYRPNYEQIIRTFKTQSPRTEICIQSVLPVNYNSYKGRVKNEDIVKLNEQLKSISKTNGVADIDLFSRFCDSNQQLHPDYAGKDGLHLKG